MLQLSQTQNHTFNFKVNSVDIWQNLFDKEDCTGPPKIMYQLQITNKITFKSHKPFTDFNNKLAISKCKNHIYPPVTDEQCCVTSLDSNDQYVSSSYYFMKSKRIAQVPKGAYGYNYCQVSNDQLMFINTLKPYEFNHVLKGYMFIYMLQDSCFAGIKCDEDKLQISKTANCNSTKKEDYIPLDSIHKSGISLKQFNQSEAKLTYRWLAYVPVSNISTTFHDKWGLFASSVLLTVLTINILVIYVLVMKYKRTKNPVYVNYISSQLLMMIAAITNCYTSIFKSNYIVPFQNSYYSHVYKWIASSSVSIGSVCAVLNCCSMIITIGGHNCKTARKMYTLVILIHFIFAGVGYMKIIAMNSNF
jgi:hypothetical protein